MTFLSLVGGATGDGPDVPLSGRRTQLARPERGQPAGPGRRARRRPWRGVRPQLCRDGGGQFASSSWGRPRTALEHQILRHRGLRVSWAAPLAAPSPDERSRSALLDMQSSCIGMAPASEVVRERSSTSQGSPEGARPGLEQGRPRLSSDRRGWFRTSELSRVKRSRSRDGMWLFAGERPSMRSHGSRSSTPQFATDSRGFWPQNSALANYWGIRSPPTTPLRRLARRTNTASAAGVRVASQSCCNFAAAWAPLTSV